ncbi:MAG: XRE family transcriptional regulator [Acidimicrobiia bacterium]|nr:XRE family transcriptional regulator [Acidimicrobiia bacterium]
MSDGTIGARLIQALRDCEVTQAGLATRIGGTQAGVSQWCTGKKIPTSHNLDAVAESLGISRNWLQSGIGPMRAVDPTSQRAAYRSQAFWGFRPAPPDGGRDFGNANVWSFDPTVEVLVREVLQNALDAGLPGGPAVRVTFRIITLRNGELRSYLEALKWAELKQHLDASTHNRQKLGSLIKDGLDWLADSKELTLLVIEDSGTTGLLGAEKGDGKFAALCRNNLDSNKEGATTKGGAFGLGKGVLWRASRFATVVFCSNLAHPNEEGKRNLRLLGRCDLPWHNVDDTQSYAGPGWLGQRNPESEDHDAVSFWENESLASDLYLARSDIGSGTSACVVGFHDPSSDKPKSPRELATEIERASAAHFFPALAMGRLNVAVQTFDGRREYAAGTPATSVEVDARQLQPEFWQILRAFEDRTFVETLTRPGDVACKPVSLNLPARKIEPKHGEYEHEALLLVRYASDDEAVDANRLAMFRGPGMVVEERKLSGICLGSRPFHALLLCGLAAGTEPTNDAADEFLRTAEPPSHNKWVATPELKTSYARGCVNALSTFLVRAVEVLRDLVKPSSRDLGDGPNSLRELFRIGPEPISTQRERPRVVDQDGHVDEQGRWCVEARIRMKPVERVTLLTPAVSFVAETGAGKAVRWQSLESTTNCSVEGFALRVPARTREVAFSGITDPESHPVPAQESSIVVDLRRVVQVSQVEGS